MGRTRVNSRLSKAHLNHFHHRKHHSQKRKKELISYLERLKKAYNEGLIPYSRYLEIIHQKKQGRTIEEWIHYYHHEAIEAERKLQKHFHHISKKRFVVYVAALILAIFLFSLVFNNLRFAGFVAQDSQEDSSPSQDYSEQLDLSFSKTDAYTWTPENSGNLTFVSVYGTIEGKGKVEIYLDDLLILDSSNIQEKKTGILTGQAIDETPDEEEEEEAEVEEEPEEEEEEEEEIIETIDEPEEESDSTEEVGETEETIPEDSSPSLEESPPSDEEETNETIDEPSDEEINETIEESKDKEDKSKDKDEEVEKIIKEFENFCQDTCDLSDLNLNKESYEITIKVSGESKVNLDKIRYGLVSDAPVVNDSTPLEEITNQTNETQTLEINDTNATITTIQERPVLGQPVKWKKEVKLDKAAPVKITIPAEAENITAYKIEEPQTRGIASQQKTQVSLTGKVTGDIEGYGLIYKLINFFKRIFGALTGRVVSEEVEITLDEDATEYEVVYETEAPQAREENFTNGKRVIISGPDELHYENILAFTYLETETQSLTLYHLVDGQRTAVEYNASDTNNNGLIDYIEWNVPHLSEQVYEIIIEITTAEHLDENKDFITDIYNETFALDDIWTSKINQSQYIRVTFEENLTSDKDITLYARGDNNATIEVYTYNSSELIATLPIQGENGSAKKIQEENYYSVSLTNLSSPANTFDIKIIGDSGAYIEVDYIVDPTLIGIIYDACNGGSINSAKFDTETSSGDEADVYATGTGYYALYSTDNAELTLHTSGLKDNFTKFTVDSWLDEERGNGRGWHFGIGTGALYEQTSCNSNTGYSPTNGYFICFKGNNGGTQIVRVDSGVETILTSNSNNVDTTTYHNYTVELNSSGIFFFVNDTLWISSSDTTYSEGYITISTGGGNSNKGNISINNVWDYEEIVNESPTTPTSITCDGGTCNNTFQDDVNVQCSGSTDNESDYLSYNIWAYYNESSIETIAHDATTTNQGSGDRSFSHTIGSGDNRLLVVEVAFEDDNSGITVNDVTYNSQSLTEIDSASIESSGYTAQTSLWYMLNPPTGAHTVTVDVSATPYRDVLVAASSYENINQATGLVDSCTAGVTSNPISCSVTTSVDNSWVMSVVENGNLGDYTYSAGTKRWELDGSASSSTGAGGDDIDTTAGSHSVSWSHSNNLRQSMVAAAFAPATISQGSWHYLGSHNNGSSYNWNLSGIDEQSEIGLRCNATDGSGESDYYTPGINLTIGEVEEPEINLTDENSTELNYTSEIIQDYGDGTYDINLTINNEDTSSIFIQGFNTSGDSNLIFLSNTNETWGENDFAIDPRNMIFDNLTLTIDASADSVFLWKCFNFNSTTGNCIDECSTTLDNCNLTWEYVKNISGQSTYNITINSTDPVFVETVNNGDALVYEGAPNTNYGGLAFLGVRSNSGTNARAYISHGNLTGIPENQIIADAQACFYYYQQTGAGSRNISIYHVLDDTFDGQSEATLTWNNQVCGTGFDDSADCNLTALDTQEINDTTSRWICWNVTSAVEKDYNLGEDDISFALKDNTEDSGTAYEHRFRSKEFGTIGLRPQLNITYYPIPPKVIFFDGFESGIGLWNLTTTGTANNWTLSSTDPYEGTSHAQSAPRDAGAFSRMTVNVSTYGYQNITFSYYRKLIGLDAADGFSVRWYNGTDWIDVETDSDGDDANYVYQTFNLTTDADDNEDFLIQFECSAGGVLEGCRVDNIEINGTEIDRDDVPITTLISPDDDYLNISASPAEVNFSCSTTDEESGLQNISLYITNSSNQSFSLNQTTNITGLTNSSNWILNLTNGNYTWNCLACDNASQCEFADENRSAQVNYDVSKPLVTLISPIKGQVSSTGNVSFICNATDDLQLTNMTFYWDYNGSWVPNGTNSVTGIQNQSNFTRINLSQGSYAWNCLACDNDSQCQFSGTNNTIIIDKSPFMETIFFEDFETGIDGWVLTTPGAGNNWTITGVDPYNGTSHAQARPASTTEPASVMQINVSTAGYDNITIAYYRKLVGLDAADNFTTRVFNGTDWIIIEDDADGNDADYIRINLNNNSGDYITLSFECTAGAALEFCRVDDIQVKGYNYAPNITYVSPIPNTNPIELNKTPITFYATMYDKNGVDDLNDNSVNATFTKPGQTTRENLSCLHVNDIDANSANYSCTIDMWYWDEAGDWNVTVYGEDLGPRSGINDSTTFQYNQLQAFTINPNNLTFNASSSEINVTANNDPMTINNTGNANLTEKIAINATNLIGESVPTTFISASNISVGLSTGSFAECAGTTLANATEVNITGVQLEPGNLSNGEAQEQLYYCIKQTPNIAQTYSTSGYGSWIIKIVFSMVLVLKKGKKKKRKVIVDDLSLPITIFTNKLGGLEGIAKYLKENLGLTYHEIAELLSRDDRTIWTSYNKSIKKQPTKLIVRKTLVFIPTSIFKNRKLTILEAMVVYLKDKGMKYVEIAKLLGRDQRNIWTIYNRAIKK